MFNSWNSFLRQWHRRMFSRHTSKRPCHYRSHHVQPLVDANPTLIRPPWSCWTMSSRLQTFTTTSIVNRSSAQLRHHPACRRVSAEQQQKGLSDTLHMRWIIWLDKHVKPGPPLVMLHATSWPAKWYWPWRSSSIFSVNILCFGMTSMKPISVAIVFINKLWSRNSLL